MEVQELTFYQHMLVSVSAVHRGEHTDDDEKRQCQTAGSHIFKNLRPAGHFRKSAAQNENRADGKTCARRQRENIAVFGIEQEHRLSGSAQSLNDADSIEHDDNQVQCERDFQYRFAGSIHKFSFTIYYCTAKLQN